MKIVALKTMVAETPEQQNLQARILLRICWTAVPVLVPVLACSIPVCTRELDLVLALEKLDAETLRDVPSDMAVHEPGARVVGREGEYDPTAARQPGNIATVGVVEGEARCLGCWVENSGAGPEDVKVVAVEMQRVWDGNKSICASSLLNDPVRPLNRVSIALIWGFSVA